MWIPSVHLASNRMPMVPSHTLAQQQHMWHQRLGHPGSEVLRRLVSNNFISCNKEKPHVLCHACQLGKHVRLPFVSSNTVVTSCFDIIHSDVWTSPILSLSGFKYYVLFLDYYSQFVWVYPLLNKSDVWSKFVLFCTYVRTQFECEIRSFQCDHSSEFNNHNFHKLFANNGIQFRFSCPKISQQNGKSERMVRTINNLIRTLLFQANLQPTFWVEALNVATHLLNFLPSTAINNEIPYTRLFGTNPHYSLIRTFGCLCYPHLHANHKLDPYATPSIYLGQASNQCGYPCLDLKINKIIISRHVTFDETVFPYGSTQPALPPTYTFWDDKPDLIPPIIPTNPVVQLPPDPITPIHTTENQAHSPPPSTSAVQQQIPTTTQSPATQHEPVAQSPIIFLDPPENPNSVLVHPMVIRFCVGTSRPTERLNLHVSSVSPLPKSYRDAFSDPNWQNVMRDEYHALIKNKTWTLVPRPPDTNIVRCMWLFRHKYLADDTLSRYKARLVANGSTRLEWVDVDGTFSPVVKPGTIRIVLSLAASRHWPIHQLDVKNAFLHGDLSETVYMYQPFGFWDSVHPDYVCLLQRHGTDIAYLLLYVDDIVLTSSSEGLLQKIIRLFLSQKKYAVEILEKAHMVNCNPSRTPVDNESKLGVDVQQIWLLILMRIGLVVPPLGDILQGIIVYFFNNLLSWSAKRQPMLSRSSAEAEYHGVANAVAGTCWLRNLLRKLHTPLSTATLVYCDNFSVVYLSSNPVQHQRMKHIEIDIHFFRDLVAADQARVLHVPSHYQFANIFPKGYLQQYLKSLDLV
ncbi:ribonuclease H-like domain-containing protein [Tanacetum coccineum]